ncbi:MAG: hypothetical protein P4L79_06130 [Legionella sp.]|uniref:hypothetical protein n=1 Tax=Legionella sp. TaxID=459 RepID=UPI00283F5E18|nr:hypothetical protein [Legionella sp.]
MNVAELQELIKKIKAQGSIGNYSAQSMDLFAQMSGALNELAPETKLTHKTLDAPFLKLTNVLYEELTNKQSMLTELLTLIIMCSRLIGYADSKTLDNYPQLKLMDKISKKRPQEQEKLEDIIFFLRAIFYLIQKHYTQEELTLLSFLIYFRPLTTDEERRSELAIFEWLYHQKANCLNFFAMHVDYINMRSHQLIRFLPNIVKLIPITYTSFIKNTQSYDLLWNTEQDNPISRNTLIEDTCELLQTIFVTQKEQDYAASLKFADNIKIQLPEQAHNESLIVYLALYLFRLNQYKEERHADPSFRHNLISLSKQTKEDAVDKKLMELRGVPVQYGFFENIALKEGRLGALNASFEEQTSYIRLFTS